MKKLSLLALLLLIDYATAACELCDQIDPTKVVSLPDPYSFIQNCGQIASALSIFDESSTECQAIQAVKTYCGCHIADNSCQICGEGMTVQSTDTLVPGFDLPAAIIQPTCGIVEAYMHSFASESDICLQNTELVRDTCGCVEEEASEPDDSSGISDKCSICFEADKTFDYPQKDLNNLPSSGLVAVDLSVDANQTITCQMLDIYLRGIEAESKTCSDARYFLSGICGCSEAIEDSCHFCAGPRGREEIITDRVIGTTEMYGLPKLSCGNILLFTETLERSSNLCFLAKQVRHLCGCNKGEYNYFNTGTNPDDRTKKKALVWVPRASGFLSFLGSAFIIYDVLKRRKGQISVYHELLCATSVFDLISSTAWMFSALPIPVTNEYGDPTAVYGARGNEASCTAQGFFLQLGSSSVFYNVALSFYYLLTVRYGWREAKMRTKKNWFHLASLIGLAFACAGIPYYEHIFLLCYLVPPPLATSNKIIVSLIIVPISAGIVLATINMLLVYLKVRSQDNKANKWRFSARTPSTAGSTDSQCNKTSRWRFSTRTTSGSVDDGSKSQSRKVTNKLERAVFWQSMFYLGAFYAVWPIFMVSYLENDKNERSYGYYLALVAITPLQGVLNVIVYTRPRLAQKMSEFQQRLVQEQAEGDPNRLPLWRRFFDKGSPPPSKVEEKSEAGAASQLTAD